MLHKHYIDETAPLEQAYLYHPCETCHHWGQTYYYGKKIVCLDCIPFCEWKDGSYLCGKIVDPSGDGFCKEHETLLNSGHQC